ncbi:MAG: precorrin-6y C5,15-methyltransferase (decarboxylating) subunit CbiE [Nitrospirota bacterium]
MTIMSNKLYVIGIGYKPLDKKAREIISRAGVILASNRLFEVFKGYDEFEAVKDKVKVINNVNETIEFIHSLLQHSSTPSFPVVLLASGDPMFFGIGRRAVKEFGRDMVEILPDLSSVQIAFSRIKEPWDDAFLMSLHGGPDPEKRRRLPYTINDIPSLLQRHNKVAILTDRENNPSEIAKILNLSPIAHSLLPVMYVCERLGYQDEKITEGTPEEIAGMTFSEPNVVIIQRSAINSQSSATAFGLKETEISHSKGLITKDEVRAVTIHKLRLPQRGVFWDIGAGSGSVSIEAARLYPELKVFAVEKDKEQINHIRENKERFNSLNIEIISGEAPDALINLPSPDRVFVGGSSGRLKEIIDFISSMTCKHIVINATTIETLNEAIQHLESNGFEPEVSEISVSRSKDIAGKRHMSALNPVFVIKGER